MINGMETDNNPKFCLNLDSVLAVIVLKHLDEKTTLYFKHYIIDSFPQCIWTLSHCSPSDQDSFWRNLLGLGRDKSHFDLFELNFDILLKRLFKVEYFLQKEFKKKHQTSSIMCSRLLNRVSSLWIEQDLRSLEDFVLSISTKFPKYFLDHLRQKKLLY